MTINLAQIKQELFPGLRGIEGKYDMIPAQWKRYYEIGNSEMAIERTSEMAFVGLAVIKGEGAPTSFDNAAGDRFVFNQEHVEVGLGYAITRKAIADNLYKSQFQPSNLGLMESFDQTKEILAANLLNTAGTYNPAVGGDGVSLVNTAHSVDNGTYANRPSVDLDFNEAALEAANIQIRTGFVDQRGLKIFARARKVLVPAQLEYVMARVWHTELRPGTTNNDAHAIHATGSYSEGYEILDFLTSPFAWFVLTNRKGLLYLQREAFETDMQVDWYTDNLLCKAYERYSFGYYNPRCVWGTLPTA